MKPSIMLQSRYQLHLNCCYFTSAHLVKQETPTFSAVEFYFILILFSVLIAAELMEAEANGHTYMHAQDKYTTTAALLDGISLHDVNAIARELCEHLSHTDPARGVVPAAVIACAPMVDRAGAF